MTQKGEQDQGQEKGGQMLLPVTKVVLEVIALGFEGVVALIFHFPAGAAGGCNRRTLSSEMG